jgi:PAS domain S-box-containing protein
MKKNKPKPRKSSALRTLAEEKLREQNKKNRNLSVKETQQVIYELQVHQIELEMQNEELRSAQEEIEESRMRYSDLYDSAPVGYFTFDRNGFILDLNLTGSSLLGIERSFLIKKPFSRFIVKEDQDLFYLHRQNIFETKTRQTCEIRLNKKNAQFYVQLQSIAVMDSEGSFSQMRTVVSDITERKKSVEVREKLIHELQDAAAKIKTLSRMLPICSSCKKIRDDKGYWNQIENYITKHSETEFTHGICPPCAKKLYGELYKEDE